MVAEGLAAATEDVPAAELVASVEVASAVANESVTLDMVSAVVVSCAVFRRCVGILPWIPGAGRSPHNRRHHGVQTQIPGPLTVVWTTCDSQADHTNFIGLSRSRGRLHVTSMS